MHASHYAVTSCGGVDQKREGWVQGTSGLQLGLLSSLTWVQLREGFNHELVSSEDWANIMDGFKIELISSEGRIEVRAAQA